MAIQKNKNHWVEYRDFNIQLDLGGQAVDGLSEVDGLGVEVHFLDFGVWTHHGALLLKEIGSTASVIRFWLGMWALWCAYKYTSMLFRNRLWLYHIRQIMSGRGNCGEIEAMERVFRSLKIESIKTVGYRTEQEAKREISAF